MASPTPASEYSKDEIGWEFVKRFYTVLNNDPSQLHRFYTKQSSLSHGVEGEIAQTFVGQRAIHEKIISLGFNECLVMLSSVDSLGSAGGGIVIQVLGELSNRDEPSQKFAETFFLAEQPNGYFVLNDIFRYLKEDAESDYDDTEPDPPTDIGHSSAHELELSSNGLMNGFHSGPSLPSVEQTRVLDEATIGDLSLAHQTSADTPLLTTQNAKDGLGVIVNERDLNTSASDSVKPDQDGTILPSPSINLEVEPSPQTILQAVAPAPEPAPQIVEEHSVPVLTQSAPPARSWATLAATNSEKWHAPHEQRSPVAAVSSHPKSSTGQMNRKDVPKSSTTEKQEPALGYIKHVGPKVQKNALHDALVKFGPLKDLDINRQKSCGFVEFATVASLQAAIAASPIDLDSTTKLVVEERRKSAKGGDPKGSKQAANTERRSGTKNEEGRAYAAKRTAKGGSKQRAE